MFQFKEINAKLSNVNVRMKPYNAEFSGRPKAGPLE